MTRKNLLKLVCCGLLLAISGAEAFSPDTPVSSGVLPQPTQPLDQDINSPACDFSHLIGSARADLDKNQFQGRPLRIIHEGDAVTQDFSPARINIILDRNDVVIDVRCG